MDVVGAIYLYKVAARDSPEEGLVQVHYLDTLGGLRTLEEVARAWVTERLGHDWFTLTLLRESAL